MSNLNGPPQCSDEWAIPYSEGCQKCGTAIADDQAYCARCGNEIDPQGVPSCPRCLAAVWKADKFCRQCGARMCVCGTGMGHGGRP